MTVITVITARDVGWVLAACDNAVMTGTAGAQTLRVVDSKYRRPDIARVTVFANVARLHMRGILAGGFGTVVAAEAVARNVHVVEIRRQPANGRMTVVAIVATGDVRRMFAGRCEAVVTRPA